MQPYELSEGKYNARDVLGMCRVYPFLLDAIERTNTANVYVVDRDMATLALQMTRAGMPVDVKERDRIGAHLRELRDAAVVELRKYTEPPYFDDFVRWVASFQATTLRKASVDKKSGKVKRAADPEGGVLDPVTGLVESNEGAFNRRVEIRRLEFIAKIEKAAARGKPSPINFGARVQQAALLRAAGVPLLKTTAKTSIPKVSKETLEELAYHAAARSMLSYILTAAIIRTFIEGSVDKKGKMKGVVLGEDGRLHPDWPIHKITGRWGSNPNVQNWSKRAGGGAENLRRMIAAPEGYIFVGADQKQLEARLIAACSQDPFLLDIFRRGADIHGEFALVGFPGAWPKLAEVYAKHKGKQCGVGTRESGNDKCDMCKQRDKVRDLTKRLEYGGFYGGSDQTLWQSVVKDFPELKITDVQAFLRSINERMQGVIRWRAGILRQALESGEIRSPILGRREVFPLGRVEPTVAYNFLPQSGGADLWALGAIPFMERWDQEGDDARLIHNGHDSVLILTRKGLEDKVCEDVHTCWERVWNGVEFLMDTKTGARWSEV